MTVDEKKLLQAKHRLEEAQARNRVKERKASDTATDSRRRGLGKVSAADGGHGLERVGIISVWAYKLSTQSRSVPVRRDAPAFSGPKGALTHHPQADGGMACGHRALSEGDCAFCGKRPPMPSGIDGATGAATPVSSPVACENLPLAAFRSLRGTKDEGRR